MSKRAKKESKERNLRAKRAKRARNRAKWDELKRSGQNKKSKRFLHINKRYKKAKMHSHINGPCGNVGCVRCFPKHFI